MSEKKTIKLWDKEQKRIIKVEAEKSGKEWKAICPMHDDTEPSLFINEEKKVYYCQGCGWKGKLYEPNYKNKKIENNIMETYDYKDEDGKLLFQVVRYHSKKFALRRRDNNDKWIYNLDGTRRVLYKLPDLIKVSDPVFIVEGEKDADILMKWKLAATTNPMGAGNWKSEFKKFLKDKDVISIPDNDTEGKKHAKDVCNSIIDTAKSIKYLELPGLKEKGDVSDWIEKGGTKEELKELVDKAPLFETVENILDEELNKKVDELERCIIDAETLSRMDIPERKKIFEWFPEGCISLIFGERGLGKTFFALSLAISIVNCERFLKWKPAQGCGVLYIDGEMPLLEIKNRLSKLTDKHSNKLLILSSDVIYEKLKSDFKLTEFKSQELINKIAERNKFLKVVIIDNISCLFTGIDENAKTDWELINNWLLRMRRRGIAIVLIHHSGKSGFQRGTSSREDNIDNVICLKAGEKSNIGANFIVEFTKSRSTFGQAIEPIEATLTLDSKDKWKWRPFKETQINIVVEHVRNGITSVTGIAEELGISRGSVSRLKKLGVEKGIFEDKRNFELTL